jgi:hypothetical protein
VAAVVSGGDDGFFGWLQTVLYLVAAWACFRRSRLLARTLSRTSGIFEARIWLFVALACFALGVNKQLDVQIWLLEVTKALVRSAHLTRQLVRVVLLAAAGAAVLLAGALAVILVRRADRGLRCALGGLVLLGPFTVLRMARFSKLPDVLGREGSLDVMLELLPTILVLVGALLEPGRVPRRGRS